MKRYIRTFGWIFALFIPLGGFSQSNTVKGRVTDGRDALIGVTVRVKGSPQAATTDEKGEFSIQSKADDILVLTYVGYHSKEVPIDNRNWITITLEPDNTDLSEVVVVGYGEQRKITTTGAISSVSGDDLVKAPVAGISNALIGMAPGLQAVQSSGEFGNDQATILIRGMATLNAGGRAPLIMIDGVERNTYNNLDPNEIESINILKDASATAVFGVRGANGVIMITTKRGEIGRPKVNVTGNLAAIQPSILPDLLESYEYALLRNEAEENMGRTPSFSDEDLRLYQTGEDPIFHPSKNWMDELIKPFSFQQNYNTNISGGSEKLRYYTSFGYFSQSGGYRQPEQSLGFPFKHNYD